MQSHCFHKKTIQYHTLSDWITRFDFSQNQIGWENRLENLTKNCIVCPILFLTNKVILCEDLGSAFMIFYAFMKNCLLNLIYKYLFFFIVVIHQQSLVSSCVCPMHRRIVLNYVRWSFKHQKLHSVGFITHMQRWMAMT